MSSPDTQKHRHTCLLLLFLTPLQLSRQLMSLSVACIHSPNFLNHHDSRLNIRDRAMLHASRHLEDVADAQLHRLICAELFGVLR